MSTETKQKPRRPRVPIDELRGREVWTPEEAARVLGRGAAFWRALYDDGVVDGYPVINGRGTCRYIYSESARAYLHGLGTARQSRPRSSASASELMAGFHARLADDPEMIAVREQLSKRSGDDLGNVRDIRHGASVSVTAGSLKD